MRKLVNNTESAIVLTDINRTVPASGYLEIDDGNVLAFSKSDVMWVKIASEDITYSDGVNNLTLSDAINHLKGLSQVIPIDLQGHPVYYYPAFAEKKLPDGSKLFKRLHGTIETMSVGENTITFSCPYDHVKIIGARIVGGEIGDYCDFMVLDDDEGTYSGVANYQLNKYGYGVTIAPDNHQEICRYDADLYKDMVIKFVYTSVSAKTMGFNFDMSEVVAP